MCPNTETPYFMGSFFIGDMVTAEIDIKNHLKLYDPSAVRKSARMALNEGISKARTETDKQIRSIWKVKQKDIKPALNVSKKASNSNLESILKVSSKPTSLKKFNPKQFYGRKQKRGGYKGGGVKITILKGKRTLIEGAFIMREGSRYNPGEVFQRVPGKYYQSKSGKKQSIRRMSIITAASIFLQPRVRDDIQRAASNRMVKRYMHHLNRLTGAK